MAGDRNAVLARLPLTGPRRIVFIGCGSGAGQTVTAVLTGHTLAVLRGIAVAAVDLHPGRTSLTRQSRLAPTATVARLLAAEARDGSAATATESAGLDVIASPADPAALSDLSDGDYPRLAAAISRRYRLAVLDPGASVVTRVLAVADQLVLVVRAGEDAARLVAASCGWLVAQGHQELAARAVAVVNGVHTGTLADAQRAEAVARTRCRAVVRLPWDEALAGPAALPLTPERQPGPAYVALAGVLVAGLATPTSPAVRSCRDDDGATARHGSPGNGSARETTTGNATMTDGTTG